MMHPRIVSGQLYIGVVAEIVIVVKVRRKGVRKVRKVRKVRSKALVHNSLLPSPYARHKRKASTRKNLGRMTLSRRASVLASRQPPRQVFISWRREGTANGTSRAPRTSPVKDVCLAISGHKYIEQSARHGGGETSTPVPSSLCLCTSIPISISLSLSLYLCLSISLSLCFSISLSLYLYLSLSSLSLYVYLSVSLSLSLSHALILAALSL